MEYKLKKKILLQASLFTIYWDQKEPSIPKDRLLFIFDNCRIQKNKTGSENFLFSYLKFACENNLTDLYQKIKSNPNHAIESLYSLFFKVPPLIYKRCQELRMGKNVSHNLVIVTAIYDKLIESQLEKIYISGYLNALSAIPF